MQLLGLQNRPAVEEALIMQVDLSLVVFGVVDKCLEPSVQKCRSGILPETVAMQIAELMRRY
jgi:hypothetical protein